MTRTGPRPMGETTMAGKVSRALGIALVVVGTSVLAAGAQAPETGGPTGGRGPGTMFYLLFRGADLTPAQEARVKEVLKAHREKIRGVVEQLRAAREELTDRFFAPGAVKAEDLEPMRQRIAQLWQRLSQDRLAAALEIRGVLTPAQLARAEKLKDRFQKLQAEMQALFEEATTN